MKKKLEKQSHWYNIWITRILERKKWKKKNHQPKILKYFLESNTSVSTIKGLTENIAQWMKADSNQGPDNEIVKNCEQREFL